MGKSRGNRAGSSGAKHNETYSARADARPGRYRFDASQVTITAQLEQAAERAQVLNVETHRAPIDDVIADIYEKWQGSGTAGPGIEIPVWQACG